MPTKEVEGTTKHEAAQGKRESKGTSFVRGIYGDRSTTMTGAEVGNQVLGEVCFSDTQVSDVRKQSSKKTSDVKHHQNIVNWKTKVERRA